MLYLNLEEAAEHKRYDASADRRDDKAFFQDLEIL
jgi:hypothetical protein